MSTGTNTHPILSFLETRVLGVLVEKQHTVPDTYPLSLNALVAGCNQKTSRDPIMEATETEVQGAIDSLKSRTLVVESSGGRVARYAHNIERVLQIPSQSAAILAMLMLRGPQTAGELRINCERLHRFADISSVEAFLAELSERAGGTLGGGNRRASPEPARRAGRICCPARRKPGRRTRRPTGAVRRRATYRWARLRRRPASPGWKRSWSTSRRNWPTSTRSWAFRAELIGLRA